VKSLVPNKNRAYFQITIIENNMTEHSTTWDPLQTSKDVGTEIISAGQKRQISNILKSYVGNYDSFSELIQNAMDAVDRRKRDLGEEDYKPKLWLTIDLKDNSFSITDNGIGFKEQEFKSFLAPNISFKDGLKTRGNKGVGATYIAYGFDYLQFGTKGNGHEFVGEITSGRDWVEDHEGIVTRPMVVTSTSKDKIFTKLNRGSTFKIRFGGKAVRPKDLSWYAATTPDQWLYLLLIKTPLGSIPYQGDEANAIKFSLTVVDKTGKATEKDDVDARYIFPHTKIAASVDLKEILKFQQKLLDQGKDATKLPGKYSKLHGLYEMYSTDELEKFRNLDEAEKKLIADFQVEAYGYFVYSTSVWDQLNDVTAKLRKGFRVLRGGLQLANNQMPQGEQIVIPLTSNTGYQNQTHVIVHFKGADPDLGRKGFQPELKELAEKLSVAIVNRLKRWRDQLKSDSGEKIDIEKEVSLHEWVKDQEKHEEKSPLVLVNKNFFAPINEISVTSTPRSEQDVIVLFNQLVAGGVIRGLKLLSTSQTQQYDGLFKFVIKQPLINHVFDKTINPLGVQDMHFSKEQVSPPKVLEYKYSIDGLIAEFENGEKKEKDIHLAVAWELGDAWKKNYEATSLLDLDNIHQRDFHGLTHVLHSSTTKFYVIALRELIDYLNDVDGVQEHHKNTYTDH
jgi:hypothetical protein